MYELLQTAAGGLKALDAHVEAPHESPLFKRYPLILEEPKLLHFIVDNFRLMAKGKINAHELEGVLDQEIEAIHEEMLQPAKSLGKIGEGMPGFGILAAVLGIVTTMNVVADGAEIGEIARSNADDIEAALDAAHAAKDKWGHTAPAERSNILLKIADRMEANAEALAAARHLRRRHAEVGHDVGGDL